MSKTRRTINFVIALAMMISGWGFLAYLLFFAAGWRGFMVLGAGLVGSLGTAWIYDDYISARPNG
ncbi:CHASE2 domain-containing sensor protein [Nitrobacteraceae bacterium AZCC 1564]